MAPTSYPRARSSGTREGSTIATSQPSSRAEAATSQPIHPAPITTILAPDRIRAAMASESATVRRYSTPSRSAPGTDRRRGTAPVASSSLS